MKISITQIYELQNHLRINLPIHVPTPPSHLVKTDKRCTADIVLLQIFHTFLGGVYGIHDNVIKCATSR